MRISRETNPNKVNIMATKFEIEKFNVSNFSF